MRLLFLSNFYPPASRGGYELWCQEVAEQLRAHGHDVQVLTSRYRADAVEADEPPWVQRSLHLEMELQAWRNALTFFTSRGPREADNLARLCQALASFNPDSMVVWGMWNLHRSLPALAESLLPGRVVYYIGDYWPTLPSQYQFYWEAPGRNRPSRYLKRLLRGPAQQVLAREGLPSLVFDHALFPTRFMRDELCRQGVRPRRSQVIYGAVDTAPYRAANDRSDGPLSLLYVGRLTEEKGVHVAIEAVGQLVHAHGIERVTLQIVGAGDPDYEAALRHLVQRERVADYVTFLGTQPKAALPRLYGDADVLLFTSLWQEPFGRVLIEAMASGTVVVGSATGGAGEILLHEETALTVPPGDAAALAAQVARLAQRPALRQRLAQRARAAATERFDTRRMAAEIEAYLQDQVVRA